MTDIRIRIYHYVFADHIHSLETPHFKLALLGDLNEYGNFSNFLINETKPIATVVSGVRPD